MANKWLEEIRQAAEITAQREQRGDQLSFRDIPRTPDELRTARPTASGEPRANTEGKTDEQATNSGTASGYSRATQCPTEAPQSAPRASGSVTPTSGAQAATGATAGPRRQLLPFTGRDPARNYRVFYRVACDFHERHNPPTNGADYWNNVTDDMIRIAEAHGGDPFIIGLLSAVTDELEREYKALFAEAGAEDAETHGA